MPLGVIIVGAVGGIGLYSIMYHVVLDYIEEISFKSICSLFSWGQNVWQFLIKW